MPDQGSDEKQVLVGQVSAITNTTTEVARFGGLEQSGATNDTLGGDTIMGLLNITAGGTATGTVQWYLQDSIDGGNTWDDMWASNTFTLGAATITQRFIISGQIATGITQSSAQSNMQLTNGSIRVGPFGAYFRLMEKVSGVGGSPVGCTYSFSILNK